MGLDEKELRRALAARSGEPTGDFVSRLNETFRRGRPTSDWKPALAIACVLALSLASVGVLLKARSLSRSPHVGSPASAARSIQSRSPEATPSTAPTPIGPVPVTNVVISAPSAQVVWALVDGPTLYLSTDQGNTWQRRTVPVPPSGAGTDEISFVDVNQGWFALVTVPMTQCSQEPIQIWHTTDGALTWQLIVDGSAADAGGISFQECKGALSFADAQHGYLAAYDFNHHPTIYRTADGGQTWQGSTLPDPPGFTTQAGGFALTTGPVKAVGSDVLVAAYNDTPTGPSTYVFRSMNGGVTWTYLAIVDGTSSPSFVTQTRWVVLGFGSFPSHETTDSGRTWHVYQTDYSEAAPEAPQVTFADGEVGYATARGDLQRTLDGGLHWTSLTPPPATVS